MFNVSEKYIEASHQSSRETDLRGKIVLKNGEVISFAASDLLQGSTHYSNMCLNSTTFNLGACYVGEFKTTIKTNIDRYKLYDSTLIVEYLLKVDEGEWEVVNIGTFTIDSAKRVGKYVELDCFDNMILLDKKLVSVTSGTLKDLFNWVCQECYIDNGMTDEMWNELVNADYTYAFSDNAYETYRDLMSDIATLAGGFATVDSFGALVLKSFSSNVIDTVDDRIRTSSKFEDYLCKYTSVSMKVNDIQYNQAIENSDGMSIQLYDNKLAVGNSDEQINTMLLNIVEKLKDIQYVPFEVEMMVNPAFELGDAISFVGYNTDNTTIVSQIHSISWTFRDSMNMSGIGENSRIANAKSATDKKADAAGSGTSQNELKTLEYTNARAIEVVGGKKVAIMDVSFSATQNENAVPLLSGQFVANVEVPGKYRILYELNGTVDDFKPEEDVVVPGMKIFTFIKSFKDLSVDVSNRLKVYLECEPLIITEKVLTKNDDDTYTLEDVEKEKSGKIRIEVSNLQAVLQSTNLSFVVKWDGNFEISDVYDTPTLCDRLVVNNIVDNYLMNIIESQKINIQEQSTCVYKTFSVYDIQSQMNLIFDYDAIPIYDLPFVEIQNDETKSGTLSNSSIVMIPGEDRAGCCASYYMQLDENVSTRITLTTDVNAQLYLIDQLTENIYNVGITSENGVIEYTSAGARFWLLILSNSRAENGAYTLTTQLI